MRAHARTRARVRRNRRFDFHSHPRAHSVGYRPLDNGPLMMLTLTPVARPFRAIYLSTGGHPLRGIGWLSAIGEPPKNSLLAEDRLRPLFRPRTIMDNRRFIRERTVTRDSLSFSLSFSLPRGLLAIIVTCTFIAPQRVAAVRIK